MADKKNEAFKGVPSEKVNLTEKKDKKSEKIQHLVDEIKKEYGIDVEPIRNNKYKFNKVKNYVNEKYDFRYNLFAKKPEFRKKNIIDKDKVDYEFFEERDFNNLHNELEMDVGISIGANRLESLIGSNKISSDYDPIKEYIFSLPLWDGKDRFPSFLAQIKLLNEGNEERSFLEKYFKKWFVTMVASLIEKDVINEVCPVFTGEEGRGKTRFFLTLVPPHLRLKYFFVGYFNPHDKDHKEMLGTKILILLDEMRTMTRTDSETIKSTMSDRTVVLRRAYGRGNIHLYRRASFAGTINDNKFLVDVGANRRWLPIAVESIDVDDDFNIDLLYAQALAIWKDRKNSGYDVYYNRIEIDDFKKRNEDYRRKAPEEDLIQLHFNKPTEEQIRNNDPSIRYLTPTDIMFYLTSKDDYKKMNANDTMVRRIGLVMHAMNFPMKKKWLKQYGSSRDTYMVIVKSMDNIERLKDGKEEIEYVPLI